MGVDGLSVALMGRPIGPPNGWCLQALSSQMKTYHKPEAIVEEYIDEEEGDEAEVGCTHACMSSQGLTSMRRQRPRRSGLKRPARPARPARLASLAKVCTSVVPPRDRA